MDNHGALGHGKVQQKQPLAIKALDEILVQKVICNKSCTIVLEDYWATQLLRYITLIITIRLFTCLPPELQHYGWHERCYEG